MTGADAHPKEAGQVPVLAVIVPHFDDVARLETCLKALLPQLPDEPVTDKRAPDEPVPGGRVEVLVVDNGTPGGLGDLPESFPQVRFTNEPEKGAACARNRGVAETGASNLLFLDADCVPAQGWLARALELAGEDRVVGGRVDTFDETPPPRSGAEAFEEVFAFRMQMYIEKKGFSGTGNLLTTRRVFEAAGPMVPGLSEDMDWCFRASAAGYALTYDDTLAVGHPTRQDWPALKRKWRRTTDEGFYLNGTGFAARLRWAVRAFAVLVSFFLHLPVILTTPKLRNGLERWRAAGTLIRLRIQRCIWMLRQALGFDAVNR